LILVRQHLILAAAIGAVGLILAEIGNDTNQYIKTS
jgi:hypothetical protein